MGRDILVRMTQMKETSASMKVCYFSVCDSLHPACIVPLEIKQSRGYLACIDIYITKFIKKGNILCMSHKKSKKHNPNTIGCSTNISSTNLCLVS